MALKQASRLIGIDTPLGSDVLALTSMNGHEELSRLFSYQLEMISERDSIAADEIVGKNVTIRLNVADGEQRHFNGFISRFTADYGEGNVTTFRAEMVPWLWFLTQTADCRIFQEMTVPEIIEKVFKDLGFSDYETSEIKGRHEKWEYCVQYRETDFNFVSRLMEQEGIFYYFRHENGKHVLVMADQKGAFKDLPQNQVEAPSSVGDYHLKDHITNWEHQYQYTSGKWAQTDYNFKSPSTSLMTNVNTKVKLSGNGKYEIYDFPGEYADKGIGDGQTKIRMEEEEVPHDEVHAASSCRTFTTGGKFTLVKHDVSAEEGKTYVITSINHSISTASYAAGSDSGASEYSNMFTCIPDSIEFRPARTTPKPLVSGVQTAVVVGPKGEEIYCDEYGRVKVQFHWDREGKNDENSSCWIRTTHNVAGKQWGFMALPRIGQELVVDFVEGDPDRPLIVGGVYNAEQMPHYELPAEMTKTYIKTNSSKGGDGYNELRIEDKAGSEQVFIHAQKDMDQRVREASREFVGTDRHLIVGGNQKELVEADKHGHVKGNHLEKIDGDMSQQVGMKRHTKVGMVDASEAGQEIHLKAGMKVIIEAGMQISLVGPGGFVDIGPAGVTIQGTMVKINSGGAAGSGSGASPQAPEAPDEADDSKTGRKSAPD